MTEPVKVRRRFMEPAGIAAAVVASLRAEGSTGYPFIPSDLDEEVARWCELNGVELSSQLLVREAIAAIPGVKRARPWLNAHSPEHRYVRRRQRAHEEENERPTLYFLGG